MSEFFLSWVWTPQRGRVRRPLESPRWGPILRTKTGTFIALRCLLLGPRLWHLNCRASASRRVKAAEQQNNSVQQRTVRLILEGAAGWTPRSQERTFKQRLWAGTAGVLSLVQSEQCALIIELHIRFKTEILSKSNGRLWGSHSAVMCFCLWTTMQSYVSTYIRKLLY